MKDCLSLLDELKRPKLLIRAARIGASDYRRERELRRILRVAKLPGSREALLRLMEEERVLNDSRTEQNGLYDVAKHVQVMIAIVGEALLIKSQQAPT